MIRMLRQCQEGFLYVETACYWWWTK